MIWGCLFEAEGRTKGNPRPPSTPNDERPGSLLGVHPPGGLPVPQTPGLGGCRPANPLAGVWGAAASPTRGGGPPGGPPGVSTVGPEKGTTGRKRGAAHQERRFFKVPLKSLLKGVPPPRGAPLRALCSVVMFLLLWRETRRNRKIQTPFDLCLNSV